MGHYFEYIPKLVIYLYSKGYFSLKYDNKGSWAAQLVKLKS